MRTRQPPRMLGERVFTSIVDLTDENPDCPTFSLSNTPPAYPLLEATSVEMESHQVDFVDFNTLTPPSYSRPTTVPSETFYLTPAPIVLDPDWLNTSHIISAIELLRRPMTLEELRKWTINKAANRETN